MSQVSFDKTFCKHGDPEVTDVCCNLFLLTTSQPGQEEDEQIQRPEVSEEDLTEAKNKLGRSGPAKSKTFEVMEECGEDTHKQTWKYALILTAQTGRKQPFVSSIWLS